MYLTIQNAEKYLGKMLVCNGKNMFHHYPLKVRRWDSGRYYYQDAHDVCMPVPDEKDIFNSVYFDVALDP